MGRRRTSAARSSWSPTHPEARRALGRLLLGRGETDEAVPLLEGAAGDFVADGLLARVELTRAGELPEQLAEAFGAWDRGDHAAALEALQSAFAGETDPDRRDLIRRVMVAHLHRAGAGRPARARAPPPAVVGAE